MNVLARSARATIKSARLARFYASEAPASTEALRLTFVVPHKAIYKGTTVQQVNLAATSGDMGILANHVPSIEQLNPGIVEIIESAEITKKFFVSGGFATINPDSSLNINAVEAVSLDELSLERVQTALAEAQRNAANAASEKEKAIAKIEADVYEALQTALTK
ncbi:epsilon subunit of F1F0-ATP synthase N-terminal domain-containing protein [Rhizopus microsporus var. microsporus]|uniref:ATP synthase subunit delta, mitochondrial n=2 Tax=Rhizopus microsporus TaxID=58291 RepID=A0A1X0QMF1_RHIZD|nr:epsilon subunit of F1F0-ATP synthase N-terminal domain-containing protein [Rhizopus microsporus var. microsporus]